ncbi:glycoside hydrolase family 20 zincin-like fold domain-containing protein [Streptomyces sp. NPDC056227]|uniref:glycoside hydrolase family 20 zincin-like fold domain-containing protein n=1 Tax=Streptomyces sp. NPDC056227 TaxID=3345753 RepID=UPI0035E0B3AB
MPKITGKLQTATSPSVAAAPGPRDPAPRTRAVNPAPAVLPSLREWQGGRGHWRLTGSSRILVSRAEAAELTETARTFASDLSALSGRTIPVTSGSARPGDVVLTAHTGDRGLGTEGYRLTSAAALTIEAPTPTGSSTARRRCSRWLGVGDEVGEALRRVR